MVGGAAFGVAAHVRVLFPLPIAFLEHDAIDGAALALARGEALWELVAWSAAVVVAAQPDAGAGASCPSWYAVPMRVASQPGLGRVRVSPCAAAVVAHALCGALADGAQRSVRCVCVAALGVAARSTLRAWGGDGGQRCHVIS